MIVMKRIMIKNRDRLGKCECLQLLVVLPTGCVLSMIHNHAVKSYEGMLIEF